jgi:hypothetical protein
MEEAMTAMTKTFAKAVGVANGTVSRVKAAMAGTGSIDDTP